MGGGLVADNIIAENLGKGRFKVIVSNGKVSHVDNVTVASAISRGKFLKAVLGKLPTFNSAKLDEELMTLAARPTGEPTEQAGPMVEEPWPTSVDGAELLS